MLDKEFRRLALDDFDFEALAKSLNLNGLDDLYAAVGASDIGVNQVVNAAQKLAAPDKVPEPVVSLVGKASRDNSSDLFIDGVGNLLTHIAGCCNPVPGDAISGYITLGRGVSIHKQDCHNMLQLQSDEPERVIKVDWSEAPENSYSVDIAIEAFDRHGLLRDVTALLDAQKINISAMQTMSDKRKNTVDMIITLEVASYSQLSHLLSRLNQLPNIASARRQHH